MTIKTPNSGIVDTGVVAGSPSRGMGGLSVFIGIDTVGELAL